MHKYIMILFITLSSCQTLNSNKQISAVFHKYEKLNTEYILSVRTQNPNKTMKRKKVEKYMYGEYTQALELLKQNYCTKSDDKLLKDFFSVLIISENSAYEYPSFILGEMYICRPNPILREINKLNSKNKKYIAATLYWGFKNVTYKKTVQNQNQLAAKLKRLIQAP